jgi:hypothetical protein
VRKICSLAALLILAGAARSPGQAPSRPPAGPGLDALVEQLGDADYRKREAAVRRLQAAGLAAVPTLKKALGHRDAEVRRRVRDLIPAIETAAFLTPRRVSLHMTKKTLRQVFDEVTRQTGYKIEFWSSSPAQTYSFDFKDLTFWEALDRICRESGLGVQQNWGDDRILLNEQGGGQPLFVRYEGPFRFAPVTLQQTRFFGNFFSAPGKDAAPPPPAQENLALTFSIYSEPRIPLLGVGEIKLDAAYDTEKNSMLPPAANAGEFFDPRFGMMRGRFIARYGNGNRTYFMQSQLNLARPSLKATGIKVIRGSLPVTLLAEQKPVVLADKVLSAKGKKTTVGTTTFLFEDVSETPGKQYQIRMTVTEDNKENPNDYTWMNTLYQRIELLDEKNNRFQIYSTGWGNNGSGQVQLTLGFGAAGNVKMGAPTKFVFQEWTTLQYQVPFEFRDLPLP